MADVSLFMQHGWQNIWKQKTIWLFSTLPIFTQLFRLIQFNKNQNLALSLLYLALSLIVLILWVVSVIGVPYLAYSFSIGKLASIQETLLAVKNFARRIIGCSCLGVLLLSPVFFLILAISFNNPARPPQISTTAILVSLPFSLFSSLWSFSVFGFFENDWGIRKSVENAWSLFTSHFGVLAMLGILLVLILRISSAMSGFLASIVQSGFDLSSLCKINYIDPSTTLSNNALFVTLSEASQIIYHIFSTSVFVLAYLKYSGAKIPSLSTRQK